MVQQAQGRQDLQDRREALARPGLLAVPQVRVDQAGQWVPQELGSRVQQVQALQEKGARQVYQALQVWE
jgi:hypothetical protein